ncbi:MAG: hypothetical protein HN390_05185 [Anaerolineae bacterium]|jgi:hypothetical protein|nr:hypothetical protein [Anaerolineae bacterium]MBT7190301.1 hypothetical protein [Anaerolineae bacterium]MBT7992196.1 hypothetical protein [Anaerolineae bacterium]
MRNSIFWDVTVPRAMTIYANAIFVVLWVGFFIALAANREWLDVLWTWAQALPLVPKIIVWMFLLPIMVGLWVWESSWTVFGHLVGFSGIVVWTLVAVLNIFRVFR